MLTLPHTDIILSPLKDLRDSISSASEDDKGLFFPQRDLSLGVGLPTTVAFALNDTRLVVGVDNGSIYVYDTAKLFSSGSDSISPLRTHSPQAGALRQIAPNPGTEPDLVDTVAVVRSDGVVQLMNTMLESLGGWSSADSNASPVAGEYHPVCDRHHTSNQTRSVLVSQRQTPRHRFAKW